MKIAYICSPFAGDIKRNKQYARELTHLAIKDNFAPITPHLYITESLDDNNIEERVLGLRAGLELLRGCDIVYIGIKYGKSAGMLSEEERAKELNIKIRYIN